ncbi:WD40 and Utp12 domain-containing protein [Phanerochaete sordida]|uniref:WD40 and Utp12 domain-containing protein n=1 Tax=Phanerochaete sordida TaxID=48140 RepID=A0A9P3G419_9APHY|nr:WD40 and Utp12 domain-containing protein [Phanerochaete sordida]
MASTPSKSKKPRNKPPKSRPANTSGISQPAVEDASSTHSLSTFSPGGELFAFLSLAVDKHRLRVYDTTTGQSVAEHVFDSRVSSLCWARFDTSQSEDGPKRKRKRKNQGEDDAAAKAPAHGVVLGLNSGSVVLFSPAHGKVVKTISHSSSTAALVSVTAAEDQSSECTHLWTSGADGVLRLWSLRDNSLAGSWKSEERIPYSCITVRPSTSQESEDTSELLAANYAVHLLAMTSQSDSSLDAPSKPTKTASFTGHASPVKSLHWDSSLRFLSTAEADRFVYLWDVPQEGSSYSEGRVAASIPLDSDVRTIALSSQPSSSGSNTLLAVSASGRVAIFPLELPSTPSKAKSKVPTLSPRSTISVSATKKQAETRSDVVAATFVGHEDGKIRVARLAGGVRPVFEVVEYLDASGEFVQDVSIAPLPAGAGLVSDADGPTGAPTTRYTESSSITVRSGNELGQDASMDDLTHREIEGELDAELAEMSLGQRLTALAGDAAAAPRDSDDEDGPSKAQKESATIQAVPAASLTRTLIQALHSSDSGLLETCLAHSNANLIQNTVKRLPPQLAVPLVIACVERLGRGKRVGRGKGGGAGAGSQRGAGLVRWVRAVLVVHGGHLLTMPDLVARLSGLHATLTSRLALQESLLSLSGRLDMVISQIEMRSSSAPAPLTVPQAQKEQGRKKKQRKKAAKYVEGESEEEEDAEGIDVEVESGDDAGSVEDVELGGSDDEDDETDSDEEDDDEEDEEDDGDEEDSDEEGGLRINGLIDDEAEEYTDEDEDDESE